MSSKILLGSGFFSKWGRAADWFYHQWGVAITKSFGPRIDRAFVVCSGGSHPQECVWRDERLIHLRGNLGGGDETSAKGYATCGWGGAMLATAMLAYANQTDYAWVEQDVLVFGDVLDQMYKDMGDKNMVFGQRPIPDEACTSLFLVRWQFIPEFVTQYLLEGNETHAQRTPERKFYRMRHRCPEDYAVLSFGCDRERPTPETLPFYVHKLTPVELRELEKRGLVDCHEMPDGFVRATNHLEPTDTPKWAE